MTTANTLGYLAMSFAMVIAAGCKAHTPQNSDLDSLKTQYQLDLFTDVGPNETVSLCGPRAAETVRAIDIWAEAIGRKGYIKYDMNCAYGDKRFYIQEVSEGQLGNRILGFTGGNSMRLVYGVGFDVVLHEVGHAWGLGHTDNGNAVMNSSAHGQTGLTDIDFASIRQVATLSDLPANEKWNEFLASGNQPTPTPTPSNASPSTSEQTGSAVAGDSQCILYGYYYPEGTSWDDSNGVKRTCVGGNWVDNSQQSTSPSAASAYPTPTTESADSALQQCMYDPRIDRRWVVVVDTSCLTQSGLGCIEGLPCRYKTM